MQCHGVVNAVIQPTQQESKCSPTLWLLDVGVS